MNKRILLAVISCVPVAFSAILLSGCQKSSVPIVQPPAETSAYRQPITAVSTAPVPSTASTEPTATPSEETKHEAQVANSVKSADPSVGMPVSATAKPSPKPKVNAEDTYQQEKPTLMGLKLGTSKTTVLNKFGKAKKQFVMDDDTDPVNVYDYTDFSVGFNKKDELVFVDVHSADIDPGLGGVRLGQKSDDAIATLGKPDSNTTFVLSYKAQGTILKLDIDPKESTIQSIKLFADR